MNCSSGSYVRYSMGNKPRMLPHLRESQNDFLRYLVSTPNAVRSHRKSFERIRDVRKSVLLEATCGSCYN